MRLSIESSVGGYFEQLNEEEMLEAIGGVNPWLGTPTTAALSTTLTCAVASGLISAAASIIATMVIKK